MIVDSQNFQATPTRRSTSLQLIHAEELGRGHALPVSPMQSRPPNRSPSSTTPSAPEADHRPASRAASVGATFKPAGLDKAEGASRRQASLKDVTDPRWANDEDVKEFFAWMKENLPQADINDSLNEAGYMYAKDAGAGPAPGRRRPHTGKHHEAGGEPEATSPASCCCRAAAINTSATDYRVIKYMKLQRFNGKTWDFVGGSRPSARNRRSAPPWGEVG